MSPIIRQSEDNLVLSLASILPFLIALIFKEYFQEENLFVKLLRLIDAAELLTRFFSFVALADLTQRSGAFPKGVSRVLSNTIEHPTFGAWKEILARGCSELCPKRKGRGHCFVAELPPYVQDLLLPYLGVGQGDPTKEIIALRNLLAHGGRLSERD